MASMEARRSVLQGFKANGFFLDKAALTLLTEFVTSMQDVDQVVAQLVNSHVSGPVPFFERTTCYGLFQFSNHYTWLLARQAITWCCMPIHELASQGRQH